MQEMRSRKGNVGTYTFYANAPVLEKVRMQTLSIARMDPGQIKEARVSGIMALGRGLDS